MVVGFVGLSCRTHDSDPRFARLSRLLKDLGGHLESLKLLKLQRKVALKKLRQSFQALRSVRP